MRTVAFVPSAFVLAGFVLSASVSGATAQDAPLDPPPVVAPGTLPDAPVIAPDALPMPEVDTDPVASPDGTLALRGEATMMAATLGSKAVFSGDEQIGDVEGVILSHDGRIVALVVGLGGFLGLAEKPVAIRYERLDVRETEEDFEFVTDLTRETLMDAPAYTPREGD